MDFVLLLVALAVVLTLCIFYHYNRVRVTNDIHELFRTVRLSKPDMVAFTLGRTPGTTREQQKFTNVTTDKFGTLVFRIDSYPMEPSGKPIILTPHGEVIPAGDGFHITGIGLDATYVLRCPPGFSGPTCTPKSICSAEDAPGTVKAITYTQFRALNLYNVGGPFAAEQSEAGPIRSRPAIAQTSDEEPIHPRLRVRCRGGGSEHFTLQTCPPNTLLDRRTLKCVPYDLCADKMNGFRHNKAIAARQSPLTASEYYICQDNRSVLTRCPSGTEYNEMASGCVSSSECRDRGEATLPGREPNTYIQCRNDTEHVVQCPNGVHTQPSPTDADPDAVTLSCASQSSLCRAQEFFVTTGLLRYATGAVLCESGPDGPPRTVQCTTMTDDRTSSKKWAEPVQVIIPTWPDLVWDGTACVTPDTRIIRRNTNLRFTDLMPRAHVYDLRTQQYPCKPGEYQINYDTGEVTPALPPGELINPALPCQSEPLSRDGEIVDGLPGRPLPVMAIETSDGIIKPPIGYGVVALVPKKLLPSGFWPRRIHGSKLPTITTSGSGQAPQTAAQPHVYEWYVLRETDTSMQLLRCRSTIIPYGFLDPFGDKPPTDDRALLHLVGAKGTDLLLDSNHQYYIFATEQVRVPSAHESEETVLTEAQLLMPGDVVPLNETRDYAIGARYLAAHLAKQADNIIFPGDNLRIVLNGTDENTPPKIEVFDTTSITYGLTILRVIAPEQDDQSITTVVVGSLGAIPFRTRQQRGESDAQYQERMQAAGYGDIPMPPAPDHIVGQMEF